MTLDRITYADVVRALEHHVDALAALGIAPSSPTAELAVNHGSKANGIAYRLYLVDPATGSLGHHPPPVGEDFLGMTARAAFENLTTRTRVLRDVRYQLDRARAEEPTDSSAPRHPFAPAVGDPGHCAICGEYDSDHEDTYDPERDDFDDETDTPEDYEGDKYLRHEFEPRAALPDVCRHCQESRDWDYHEQVTS